MYVQALQVKHPIIDWKVHIEGQRSYWKIIRLGGSSACYQFFVDLLKHLDREDLNQLWVLVKEYLSIRPASSDKEMELWVELKRLYEPDPKHQLWAQTQNYMHAPTEWKLYDLSGVHHVTAKDKELFMLVEKDYPLRKGLALAMISYRLQGRIVGNKMHKAFRLLVRKFPLLEGTSHCLKKNATARRKVLPLPEVCTAIIVKEKPSVKDDSFLAISAPCPALYSSSNFFANMRRVGKGFSGVDTPLFEAMLVPQQVNDDVADDFADDVADVVADAAEPTPPSPTTTPPALQQELLPLSSQVGGIAALDADEDVTLEEVAAEVAKDAKVRGRLEESCEKIKCLA
nr:hypothetical protein [Tanacetum cinerariifolium]